MTYAKFAATRIKQKWTFLVPFLLVLPSPIWLALDQRVWPWDQAWYGEVSVNLFYTLTQDPAQWLAVYTFVFSVVFKARWTSASDSKTEFALVLFAGLIVFNLLSECVNRAPSLIISNVNYVKKVIFPLEILPIVALGSTAFHFMISLCVWTLFYLAFFGTPPVTIIQLPLVMIPLVLMTLGFAWLLASLGVYLRDVAQIVGIMMTVLMFLSPIFYPVSALPEKYQTFIQVSPLTNVIEQARDVMIWGKGIDWVEWFGQLLMSTVVALLGFAWFQKTRKGFSDVL